MRPTLLSLASGTAQAVALAAVLTAAHPAALHAAVQQQDAVSYHLYVANESSDILSRVVFTPGEGARVEAEVPVGIQPMEPDSPHGLAVSPDGEFVYVSLAHGTPFGYAWKLHAGPDTLVARTTLGRFPASMGTTPDGQFLLVVNFNLHGDMVPSDLSVVYTPSMTEVARIETCLMPHGSRVNSAGTRQYSTCMHSDQIVELDLTTFQLSNRFSVTPGREGLLDLEDSYGSGRHHAMEGGEGSTHTDHEGMGQGGMDHAGMHREGHDTTDHEGMRHGSMDHEGMDHGAMAGMDYEAMHALHHPAPPEQLCSPTWVTPGTGARRDRVAYVACNALGEVLEVDLLDWRVLRRFETGRGPYNLEPTPDGRLLVVSLKADQGVSIIDLDAGREVARIPTSRAITHGVAISPDGRYAFISNESIGSLPGSMDVIDLESLEQVAWVELRHQSGGIGFWKMTGGGVAGGAGDLEEAGPDDPEAARPGDPEAAGSGDPAGSLGTPAVPEGAR